VLELQKFAPPESSGKQVQYDESLLPVVERIARVLPKEKVWEYFYDDKYGFPYLRGNLSLILIDDYLELHVAERDSAEWYKSMSEEALKVLVWVEIGFEGLDNLAASPASRNWESIKTHGRSQYEERLRRFADFRKTYPGKDTDCFAQYGLEYLLDRWQGK